MSGVAVVDESAGAEPPPQVSVADLLARYRQPEAGALSRRHRRAVAEEPAAAPVEPERHALGVAVLLAELLAATAIGAALWLGFRWLWTQTPVVAVVVALVATVVTVVVARRVAQAHDVLSILLAVVVALVVTTSPAALKLVGR